MCGDSSYRNAPLSIWERIWNAVCYFYLYFFSVHLFDQDEKNAKNATSYWLLGDNFFILFAFFWLYSFAIWNIQMKNVKMWERMFVRTETGKIKSEYLMFKKWYKLQFHEDWM